MDKRLITSDNVSNLKKYAYNTSRLREKPWGFFILWGIYQMSYKTADNNGNAPSLPKFMNEKDNDQNRVIIEEKASLVIP